MDLLTKYPHALEQLAILKKDYLGVDTATELSYSIQVGQRNNGGLQMRDFEMFSSTGNAAVEGIVDNAAAHFESIEDAYGWAAGELELLGTTSTYSEADDTAVREAVYEALKQVFVAPVFKTVRA